MLESILPDTHLRWQRYSEGGYNWLNQIQTKIYRPELLGLFGLERLERFDWQEAKQ